MSSSIFTAKTLAALFEYDSTAVQLAGPWSSFTLDYTFTNGSISPALGSEVIIYYLVSNTDLGATPSTLGLSATGRYDTSVGSSNKSGSVTLPICSDDLVVGQYLYIWVSHDNLNQPVTLSLTVTPIITNPVISDGNLGTTLTLQASDDGNPMYLHVTSTGVTSWNTIL